MIRVYRVPGAEDRWAAIGETRFDPEPHTLCEGALFRVLAILVSVYGSLRGVHIERGRA